jgi:hypothetical protein
MPLGTFTLKLYSEGTHINFLSDPYQLVEGGFDIGTPEVKREFGVLRPGFFIPTMEEYSCREATIKFNIVGSTRGDILSSLREVQMKLRQASQRQKFGSGERLELIYGWPGASGYTYFEVYGGDWKYPSDLLSAGMIHYKNSDGNYVLPELELKLYLSPQGYGLPLASSPIQVPLWNPSVGANSSSKTTNWVTTSINTNPWVEVNALDLDMGSTPLVTRIEVKNGASWSTWKYLYIGVDAYPHLYTYKMNAADIESGEYTYSTYNDGYSGQYAKWTFGSNGIVPNQAWALWPYSTQISAMLYVFWIGYDTLPTYYSMSVGYQDFTSSGIFLMSDFVRPSGLSPIAPLGVIQMPPVNPDIIADGSLGPDIRVGVFAGKDATGGTTYLTLDSLLFLPVTNGLRIWQGRSNALVGVNVDDGWHGLEYNYDELTPGFKNVPWIGMLEPIKLEPRLTQRLYFVGVGELNFGTEVTRQLPVKLYVVPTYETMAL